MHQKQLAVWPLVVLMILAISSGAGPAGASGISEASHTGWMDTDLLGNDKDGSKPYIDAHHLYLIWDNKFEKGFRIYAEVELEHAPSTGDGLGTIKLERLYSEVAIKPGFNVRLGKFNTPFGYWTPTHWMILVETVLKPIHEDNKYIPPKSVGLECFGRLFVGKNDIEWNAFISNGSESDGTDKPKDRTFGGGVDARYNFLNGDAFIGGSAYQQRNPSKKDRDENSTVGYAGVQFSGFDIKTEYVSQNRGNGRDIPATPYKDVSTYYVSGRYFIVPSFAPGVRIDNGKDDKSGNGLKHNVTSVFLNWIPIPGALGKVEYNIHNFDDATVKSYNSWALYFGLVF